jgi:hypothetical protein
VLDFMLGIIIGMAVGGLLVHVLHEYADSLLAEDEEENQQWLGQKK